MSYHQTEAWHHHFDSFVKANKTTPTSASRQALSLLAWLLLCFSAALGASVVSIDGWYGLLNKPSWTPPGWVFGPAWTVLYALMAVAAWLVWLEGGWEKQRTSLRLFLLQWLLNTLWTPLFFGAHLLGLAFIEIAALWVAILVTLIAFWRVKTVAGILMIPYLAWVSFAAALNFTLWRMN